MIIDKKDKNNVKIYTVEKDYDDDKMHQKLNIKFQYLCDLLKTIILMKNCKYY